MATRLNITVEDDIPDKLTELAGGRNKMGEYITNLVRSIHEGQSEVDQGSDYEALRYQLLGVIGKQKETEGRLLQIEKQLAAVIAKV